MTVLADGTLRRGNPPEPSGWATVRAVARTGRQMVHVEHSVLIEQPVLVLSGALIDDPARWFPGLETGNSASIGLHIAGIRLRKKVTVEFGAAVRTSTWAVAPVSWKATFPDALFPVMAGKVDLSPVNKRQTRLTVSGLYEPPFGRLGEMLNEALMRGVAQATVKELAERIAGCLANPGR